MQHLVKKKVGDTKLHYLIQYTKGDVQELMRSFLIMKDGFKEAMRLLEKRYGKPYIIATAYITRLVSGPIIRSDDGEGLQKLAINLTSCVNTLKELGCLAKLESLDNLKKLIDRLQHRLRVSWRDEIDNIIQKDNHDVNIQDISEVVTAKARATAIGGQEKNYSKDRKPTNSKKINYAVNSDSKQQQLKCILSSETHWLSRCEQFMKKSVESRLKFIQKKHICRNCHRTFC
ncbi:uncharacterized protein [Antedon mediterranea]|uniref:uncharacterized protein n=1 Tax=Antedon mediterranea TaxID=105859 RepID=UPI003AF9B3EC